MRLAVGLIQLVLVQAVLSPTDKTPTVKTTTEMTTTEITTTDKKVVKQDGCPLTKGQLQERCGDLVVPKGFDVKNCLYKRKVCSYKCNRKSATHYKSVEMECTLRGQWVPVITKTTAKECKTQKKVSVPIVKQGMHYMKHINSLAMLLLKSSYGFISLASHYERADVNLPGFSKFMEERQQQHSRWANDVIRYLNKRGGYINFCDISATPVHSNMYRKKPGMNGLHAALIISKKIHTELIKFRQKLDNSRKRDPHLKHKLELYIDTSTQNIYQTGRLHSTLVSFPGKVYSVAEYAMDGVLQEKGAQIDASEAII